MSLGATSAAVEPTAENSPSTGAGTPEKASHGVLVASVASALRAAGAETDLRRAAAIVVDEPAQLVGAGLAAEVPGGVGGDHGAAQRVAAEHHVPAELAGGCDHVVQVLDGDLQTPLAGEGHRRVGDRVDVAA